jgi:hypothetical protein
MRRRVFLTLGLAATVVVFSRSLHAEEQDEIRLRELYNKDRSFSDYALSFEGQRIAVTGFMAPPLKAESKFFVLTKKPMAVCPFCEKEADWPDDILAIYAKRVVDVTPFNVRILVKGRLELGPMTDKDTGFVSRVRLTDAVFARH